MSSYYLNVCYNGFPSFNHENSFDRKIELAVGKESSGSGYGGGRDVGFTFKSKRLAQNASRRVRRMAAKKRRRVACSIQRN